MTPFEFLSKASAVDLEKMVKIGVLTKHTKRNMKILAFLKTCQVDTINQAVLLAEVEFDLDERTIWRIYSKFNKK